jgi:hypothetical protein
MTLVFKSTYIYTIRERYFSASKKEKTAILDELCKVTGYNRKYAIKVLAKGHMMGKKASGKRRAYSTESVTHLQKLWHILGRICSKKMVGALPIWLDYYKCETFSSDIKLELLSMSHATIDRYLSKYKSQFSRRKRTGTVRAKKFCNIIPIKNFEKRNKVPGFLQADTVAHCGNSLSGTFVWTLTVTDEVSGWTENRASYGKDAQSILCAISKAIWKFPCDIKSFNTDNGTEFINEKLKLFLKNRSIPFTRSRAYKKNDNAHVEQKNFTHVRELFGYERFEFG